jgi:hypothetical protein
MSTETQSMDLREELVMKVEYLLSDSLPVVVEEYDSKGEIKGGYPMMWNRDEPFTGYVKAKDQFNNEIEVTTDMDGWSLNITIEKQSPEWKAILAMKSIEVIAEQASSQNTGYVADLAGIAASHVKKLGDFNGYDEPTKYFVEKAEKFKQEMAKYDGRLTVSGEPILSATGIDQLLKERLVEKDMTTDFDTSI